MISVMGMGGRTIATVLREGEDRLRGASLLLSAHTDWPLIRQAVADLGYHVDREEPCFAAGRWYLFLRARPGAEELTPRQVRMGVRLADSGSPLLPGFLARRREVLGERLRGLETASSPDREELRLLREDLAEYDRLLEDLS